MEDDLDVFFNTDEFADSATYVKQDDKENPITVKVIFDFQQNLAMDGRGSKEVALFHVKKSDVDAPRPNDTLSHSGITWTVEQVQGGDGFVWIIQARSGVRGKFK